MKAILLKHFGGIENFELAEVERPQARRDEVLIRIRATAFNPIDYQMRQGSTESKLLKSPILGRELSGEIVEVGKDVTSYNIGDKVSAYVGSLASNGTYAEFISVPSTLIAKNPSGIPFEEAAAIPMVGMTALQCFNRINMSPGEPIFIAGGAGGVGTLFIKLLVAAGIKHIYTTAGNEDSFRHLMTLGVSEQAIIDYKKDDAIAALKAKNGSFHYVVDLVGDKMSEMCAELVTVFGTYLDVTFLATPYARELLFDKATTIVNIANYAPALTGGSEKLEYYGTMLKALFEKIDAGILSPAEIHVVGNLSAETVQRAHQLMEANETKGKKLIMSVA